MATTHKNPEIPQATEDDMLFVLVDDIIDPNHTERWKIFTEQQPVLARMVWDRAAQIEDLEARQAALFLLTFTYSGLARAVEGAGQRVA